MTRATRGRAGVTLIEILVVLAIIGILIALTAAALQKTVETQNARTSETQVFKLQQALDAEYDRVVTKCAQDAANDQIHPQIVVACDGNKARAKAVWTAFQLRLNFPDTFEEAAITPLTIVDNSGNPVYSIARPTIFAPVAAHATDATLPARREEESGVLLYLILAKRSVQGGGAMATGAEDVTQASRRKVTFGGVEFETFADAFKQSVGFRRWEQTRTTQGSFLGASGDNNTSAYNTPAKAFNEVQNEPYVDPKVAFSRSADTMNRDPLDPQGLIPRWADALPVDDKRRIIRAGVYPEVNPTTGQPTGRVLKTGLYFNGQNRMPNVYSLGRSKFVTGSTTAFSTDDDILGFRLRKPGEKGYKQ